MVERKNVGIDREIYKKIKRIALEKELSLKALIESILTEYLGNKKIQLEN